MKKTLSVILAALMLSALAVGVSAKETQNEQFTIPKAATPPVLDGVMDDGEWDNALVRDLTADDVYEPTNIGTKFEGATFYWMWDDDGIYFAADVTDTTPMKEYFKSGAGSYNAKDGVQIRIYGSPTATGSTVKTLLFYSFAPTSTDGTPQLGEHFCYGTGSNGADVPEDEGAIAATYNKSGSYLIEGFIAKEGLAKTEPSIKFGAGTSLPLANIILDEVNGKTSIFSDTPWFDAPTSNKYILSEDEVAGYIEEVEAPTAEAGTAAGNPSTADPIMALVALVSVAGLAVVSKKRK